MSATSRDEARESDVGAPIHAVGPSPPSDRADAVEQLAAYLAGRGPLPASFVWLAPYPELRLLRSLCASSPARAMLAAEAFVELEPPAPAAPSPRATAPATPLVPSSLAPEPTLPPEPPAAQPEPPAAAAPEPIAVLPPLDALARDVFDHAQDAALRVLALEEQIARLAPWVDIGWHRAGSALSHVVHDRLRDLERLLAKAPALAAIADLVGRMEAASRRGQHAERGGRESVVGVTYGGELADVLPSELALLADPATEDLFLQRLAERRLLSLELEGSSHGDPRDVERRGPALVCIDTSGSMIGAAEELGKAATLVLLRRVLGEGRRAEVALFGGEGAIKTAVFRPGATSLQALFDLLMTSYHGGTDFDGPLRWALDRRREGLPHADIVLVTDGRGRLHDTTVARLDAARRAAHDALRLVLVHIDPAGVPPAPAGSAPDPSFVARDPGPLRRLADEVVHVRADGSVRRGAAASSSRVANPSRNR